MCWTQGVRRKEGVFYELAANTWGPEEIKAVQGCLDRQQFTMGESVAKFEAAFSDKFGTRHAVMVSSGSAANLVGIAALFYKKENPLKPGDEVIVPAISWSTTYYPLLQYGLRLRFVDVDLKTLNLDCTQLEKALSPKTRMVVAVSILGNPCELDVISQFCQKHGLYLFEDNCESMGASLNGRLTGTFGNIGTFSSFFSHHISTMEGGVVVTNDTELCHLVTCLRAHGWTRNLPTDSPIYEKRSDDFYEAYRFILPGYNVRPLEISGAIGIEQLRKLDRFVETRRKNAALFVELFGNDERFIIQKEHGKSSWFAFTMIVNPKVNLDRRNVFRALSKADIGYRIITGGNFLRHDVIKYFNYETVGEIVNANFAHDRGFFVGNYPSDLRPQIERLHSALRGISPA